MGPGDAFRDRGCLVAPDGHGGAPLDDSDGAEGPAEAEGAERMREGVAGGAKDWRRDGRHQAAVCETAAAVVAARPGHPRHQADRSHPPASPATSASRAIPGSIADSAISPYPKISPAAPGRDAPRGEAGDGDALRGGGPHDGRLVEPVGQLREHVQPRRRAHRLAAGQVPAERREQRVAPAAVDRAHAAQVLVELAVLERCPRTPAGPAPASPGRPPAWRRSARSASDSAARRASPAAARAPASCSRTRRTRPGPGRRPWSAPIGSRS